MQLISGKRRINLCISPRPLANGVATNPELLKPIDDDQIMIRVFSQVSPTIISDTSEDRDWIPTDETAKIASWIAIPLYQNQQPIGLILLSHLEKNYYDHSLIETLNLFATHAELGIRNAGYIEELEKTKDYLEEILGRYEEFRNMASIGRVFGETFHYALSQFGRAKAMLDDIELGLFDNNFSAVKSQASAVRQIINNYLTRVEEARNDITIIAYKRFDVQDLAMDVVTRKRVPRNINIAFDFTLTDAWVTGTESQTRQVFFVVIHNAIQAIGRQRGNILITSSAETDNGVSFIVITVSDSGNGIPLNIQKDLFTIQATNTSKRGSGFGLAWSRSFLRTYGGDISFTTKLGQGTKFYLKIPRVFKDVLGGDSFAN
jgi:signal transduction histidine kinase